MDFKARLRNKPFLVALFSAFMIVVQQLGLHILPANIEDIFNAILGLLVVLGVVVDPTTPGITDKPKEESAN